MIEDRELVLGLKKNETQAFDSLYWKYHQAIYRNALKLTKDEQVASDILQEVFCSLWEKRQTIDPEQSVSGWLFVLSFNQSVSFQRKKLRESITIEMEHNETDIEGEVYQFKYTLMQKAVEQLSPQKQKVFTLCKLYGKTYEETAGILNISKHTVKEYLSGSMVSIKEFIKQNAANWRIPGNPFEF